MTKATALACASHLSSYKGADCTRRRDLNLCWYLSFLMREMLLIKSRRLIDGGGNASRPSLVHIWGAWYCRRRHANADLRAWTQTHKCGPVIKVLPYVADAWNTNAWWRTADINGLHRSHGCFMCMSFQNVSVSDHRLSHLWKKWHLYHFISNNIVNIWSHFMVLLHSVSCSEYVFNRLLLHIGSHYAKMSLSMKLSVVFNCCGETPGEDITDPQRFQLNLLNYLSQ